MGLPQNAFQWNMQLSSSISLGTTTQTLKVGSSATVSISGLVYQEKIRLPLSGSIILGTTTQTLSVGASATVTQSGAWPVARVTRVHKNGTGQLVTSGVITKMTWSTAEFDQPGVFDDANDRFTPAVAGKWMFWGAVLCPGADAARVQFRLKKNGSAADLDNRVFQWFGSGAGQNISASGFDFFNMNGTTDYMEAYVLQETGSDQTVNGNPGFTWFSAMYLGA